MRYLIITILVLQPIIAAEANTKPRLFSDKLVKELSEIIQDQRDEHDIPGLNIMLAGKQGLYLAKSFGYRDVGEDKPTRLDTVFRLGGVGNIFIAHAILKLAEEKRLNLDDKVSIHLPEFSIRYRQATAPSPTLRQLLSHHSGLPNVRLQGMWSDRPEDWRRTTRLLERQYASFPPDTIYAYSAFGYNLLALVIEKVTGDSFEQYIERVLFKPLSMSSTKYRLLPELQHRIALPYKEGRKQSLLFPRDIPTQGAYSTVEDMTRYVQMLLNDGVVDGKPVFSSESIQELFEQQNKSIPLDLDRKVGLGWQLSGSGLVGEDHVAITHGSTLYFGGRITISLKHGLGVVILCNSAGAFRGLQEISQSALMLGIEHITGKRPEKAAAEQANTMKIPGQVEDFAHEYATFIGLAQIRPDEEEYEADVVGWSFTLRPQKTGWYNVQYDFLGVIPLDFDWITKVRVAAARVGGRHIAVTWHKNQRYLFGIAIDRTKEISAAWKKRLGEYRIRNRDAFIDNMEVQNGVLVINSEGRLLFNYRIPNLLPLDLKVPIQPISDKEAIIPGMGTFMNETITVVPGEKSGEEYLRFSGYDWERVRRSNLDFSF